MVQELDKIKKALPRGKAFFIHTPVVSQEISKQSNLLYVTKRKRYP